MPDVSLLVRSTQCALPSLGGAHLGCTKLSNVSCFCDDGAAEQFRDSDMLAWGFCLQDHAMHSLFRFERIKPATGLRLHLHTATLTPQRWYHLLLARLRHCSTMYPRLLGADIFPFGNLAISRLLVILPCIFPFTCKPDSFRLSA